MSRIHTNKNYQRKTIIAIIIIVALILSFLTYFIKEGGDVIYIMKLWLQNPFSFILNTLPIIALALILLAIFSRLDISLILTSLIIIIISYVNKFKILYREEPLFLADIFNFDEALNMIIGFGFGINEQLIFTIIFAVLACLLIYFLTRKYRLRDSKRLSVFLTTLSLSIIFLLTLYSSEFIYDSFPRTVDQETSIAESYKDKGLVYCLLYHRDSHRIKKPINYDEKYLAEVKEDFTYKKPRVKPHVVMVMGEAWTDLSENLDFKKGKDPYKNAKKLIDESLYSGHIICPTYGGGTSNTEYDSLTGASCLKHSTGIFNGYSAIRGPRKSIVRTMADNGYSSIAIHPGKDWFYNRENVYDYLGFDESYFENEFKDPDYKGGFVSDEELTDYIIDKFEENYKDGPLFQYVITIQNHSPYNEDKYGYIDKTIKNKDLDQDTIEVLETYFMGIRDMDRQIKELSQYFNSIDEPVVFIYYGDHQPFLNSDYEILKEIGLDIDTTSYKKIMDIYKTPFFIWGNDTYKKSTDLHQEEFTISANFLAPLVLRSADLVDTDPIYQYLDDLMYRMPVIFKYFNITRNHGRSQIKQEEDFSVKEEVRMNKFETVNYYMTKEISDQ